MLQSSEKSGKCFANRHLLAGALRDELSSHKESIQEGKRNGGDSFSKAAKT